jgi:hypothetical protein
MDTQEIQIWYARWRRLSDWKKGLSRYSGDAIYEISAIRERHSVTALCYYGSEWLQSDDFSKMEEEITKCKKINPTDRAQVYKDIVSNITEMRHIVGAYVEEPTDFSTTVSTYSYLDFNPKLRKSFITAFAKYQRDEVVTMLLRYECLCPQGQQWAVPSAWLQTIQSKFGLSVVAFASPINVGADVPYCSGYPEDKIFGSMGSFFKLPPDYLEQFSGRVFTVEINPPFIEQVLADAATAAEGMVRYSAGMERPPRLTIIFIGPDWTDSEYYRKLSEQVSTIKGIHIRKMRLFAGKYAYENPAGESIVTHQSSWLFVITNHAVMDVPLAGFLTKKK